MPKNAQTTTQLHSSHMLAKRCWKFSKPDFNSMWTMNFQMFKLDLEKTEEPEIKLPTFIGSSKKQESSRKTSTSALLTMPKPSILWITTNYGKFFKRWEYQNTWPVLRNLYAHQEATVRTGHRTDWFQIGKEFFKAVYCHPAHLTCMQSMSCELPDWMKHKLESRLFGKVSITSDIQMAPSLWQKVKRD